MRFKPLNNAMVFFVMSFASPAAYAYESEEDKELDELMHARSSSMIFSMFPEETQKEIMGIVKDILDESKDGPASHVEIFHKSGAEAAMFSFSPKVQAKIKALADKLTNTPSFNNPDNLKRMEKAIPASIPKK